MPNTNFSFTALTPRVHSVRLAGDGKGYHVFSTRQLGIAFERKIAKNIHIGAACQMWKNWKWGKTNKYQGISEPNEYMPPFGKLLTRYNYKMIDAYLLYKYHVKNTRHIVSAGVGASYCWGFNTYIDFYYTNPNYPYDGVLYKKRKNVEYYGVIPHISYDYSLLKNRMIVGADIRARYYVGRSPAQYDYGLHVGVNF